MADHKISEKVKKIMHEGIKGKKVSQKQAVAVAFSMSRKAKKLRKGKE